MIRVSGLSKTYEGADKTAGPAIVDIGFQNDTGKFLTLLGPSGCGKSTTLRCIAGLETPDAGEIQIGDQVVFSSRRRVNVSPARRKIGMVFQSYAIWPHMTVRENVAYPLRFRRLSSQARREQASSVLDIVGLQALADRSATRLSGGQQQRVALARALVGEPEVLLLDEPLSNLDTALRQELGAYVRRLQQELGLTVIYVTHDQGEALSMSDSIALMDMGRITDRADPVSMYTQPRSRFAASFLGATNYLPVLDVSAAGEQPVVRTQEGRIAVNPNGHPLDGASHAAPLSVMIRPEHFELGSREGCNRFEGEVVSRRYFGVIWEYQVRLDGGAIVTVKVMSATAIAIGDRVVVSAAPELCVLVADGSSHISASTDDRQHRPDPVAQSHEEVRQ